MFRLFLVNLLKSAKDIQERPKNALPPRKLRNRRIYERFEFEHKHLALMNEQDIFVVRDMSESGFSTEVSERGYKRLFIGDIYLCRIRYLGEVYEASAKVAWKAKGFVGFFFVNPSHSIRKFVLRLLKPMEIGTSLQKMDEKFAPNNNEGMDWYHGLYETNLYLWYDEASDIRSWRFEDRKSFIQWDSGNGVVTGRKKEVEGKKQDFRQPWQEETAEYDVKIDEGIKRFACDVFMVLKDPFKDKLLDSIIGA